LKRRCGSPPDCLVSSAGNCSRAERIAAAKSCSSLLGSPMVAAPIGDDGVGALRLGEEHQPFRHIVVPFDQRRLRTAARNRAGIEVPNRSGESMFMIVNQERRAIVINVLGMATEMYLANMLDRKRI